MRRAGGITLLVWASVGIFLGPPPACAQACKDETAMVEGSKQTLMDLVATVKKETLADFQSHEHQKSAATKLGLHASMLGELVRCLDKAAQDSSATPDAKAAAKTQHDASAKLLENIQRQRDAIKNAQAPKDAKALVENLDLGP